MRTVVCRRTGDVAVVDQDQNIVAEFFADVTHIQEQNRDRALFNANLFLEALKGLSK